MKRILLLLAFVLSLACSSVYAQSENNKIYYTSSDREVLAPNSNNFGGASILSNTYEDGLGCITFDSDVTLLGDNCFSGSKLKSITIPESVTSLGPNCFRGSKLLQIKIPESVMSLGDNCFSGCSGLSHISIPQSVISLGKECFSGCFNLWIIDVDPNNPVYDSRQDCNAIIETATNELLVGCISTIIPESITSLGDGCFKGCDGLVSITIPESVTSLGDGCFEDCYELVSITIPESVTSLGDGCFSGCLSLPSIKIPERVTSLGDGCFYWCDNLVSITIPEGVTSFGDCCFYGCPSLTSVKIPESVTSLGFGCFEGCSSLTSITIPEGVTSLEQSCFDYCSSLTTVIIPESVTSLGYVSELEDFWSCFGDCSSLNQLVCAALVPPSVGNMTFSGAPVSEATLYVPAVSLADYANHSFWGKWGNIRPIENQYAHNKIYYTSTDGDIVSPYNRDGFGANIVSNTYEDGQGCITFDRNVTSMGENSFLWRSNLRSITIPESVVTLGDHCFGRCDNLVSVEIPNGVTSLGANCFDQCGRLSRIELPNSVTSLGSSCFFYCSSLVSISLSENLTSLGENCFVGCSNIVECICPALVPPTVADVENTFMEDIINNAKLYVPEESYHLYVNDSFWGLWGSINKLATENVEIQDGTTYSETENFFANLTYTRTFKNTAWQSMYVPFGIPVSVLEEHGLEVAEIYNVHQYDRDEDGVYEVTNIDFLRMKSGVTQANYPYMVRAKEAGDVTIELRNTEFAGAESVSIDCSTVKQLFTFTGTYDGVSGSLMFGNNYYAMNGNGALQRAATTSVSLKSQRWYLAITNRDGSPVDYYVPNVRITVDGIEEEGFETSIEGINAQPEIEAVYTLSGKLVNGDALTPGIYVKGGKKIIVK